LIERPLVSERDELYAQLSADGVAQEGTVDIDNQPGVWLKRNLYNFPDGLPAGSHTFVGVFFFDGTVVGTVTVTITFT
jgi:hypothetical protein